MNAIEILESWLKERGYDGLCYPEEECGCQIGDLMPCSSYCGHCQPGYLHKGGLMYLEPEQEKPSGPQPIFEMDGVGAQRLVGFKDE
jgi:hypothetical protein